MIEKYLKKRKEGEKIHLEEERLKEEELKRRSEEEEQKAAKLQKKNYRDKLNGE
jgi:hypothetical protein